VLAVGVAAGGRGLGRGGVVAEVAERPGELVVGVAVEAGVLPRIDEAEREEEGVAGLAVVLPVGLEESQGDEG
jgi:hypothetical protein